ncbi:hypothetical protein DFH27DRAFT_547251 [Peziza echinospora]|nr:hypothetical protein DFH27DRAFT_547251 [Peziza echinospora]
MSSSSSSTRHHIQRPLTFLSLVPVQSESYPKAPPAAKSPVQENMNIITAPAVIVPARRHSSTSSVNSQRFLKLGPVHWGGETGGDDYAIEE